MSDNPFSGMGKEDLSGSGSKIFFVPGKYSLLRIQSCRHEQASKFKKKEFFLVNIEVLESNVDDRPAGTVIEYMVMKTLKDGSPNPHYFKNIKKLLMAAFNTTDPADVDEELMALVIGEKQAAAGKYISAVATNVPLGKGGEFTNVDWKHEAPRATGKSLARAEA